MTHGYTCYDREFSYFYLDNFRNDPVCVLLEE